MLSCPGGKLNQVEVTGTVQANALCHGKIRNSVTRYAKGKLICNILILM